MNRREIAEAIDEEPIVPRRLALYLHASVPGPHHGIIMLLDSRQYLRRARPLHLTVAANHYAYGLARLTCVESLALSVNALSWVSPYSRSHIFLAYGHLSK